MDKEKEVTKPTLTEKIRKNPWILSTFVLLILSAVLVINGSIDESKGDISANEAGNIILDLAKSQIEDAEVIETNSKNGLYEVILFMEEQEIPIYITKDGENLVSLTPLSLITDQQAPEEYSEEDLEKISVFIDCLAEKGVKIYGANWCGWTKKLVVETLGGFNIASPIYVECTENEELCSQEVETGYPTTKINGVLYEGERTFEGLSEVTGCLAPEVSVQSINQGQEASC